MSLELKALYLSLKNTFIYKACTILIPQHFTEESIETQID